jgi:putative Mn2+ efflux pump MntP
MAFGLAMDCAAVSASIGLNCRQGRFKTSLKLAAGFGSFQAILFFAGWAAGMRLKGMIGGWDHWIAFLLLSGIGGKMIHESFQEIGPSDRQNLTWSMLLALSLATSIDAAAAGLSYSILADSILLSVGLVGLVSFLMTLAGFFLVSRVGEALGGWAERLGGIILIAIGLKVLVIHLWLGI